MEHQTKLNRRTFKVPIVSERLRIRRFEPGDTEPFVSFMTDTESTRFLTFDDGQKSRKGAVALLEATMESYDSKTPMMAFAVENTKTNEFVGFCGLTPHNEGTVEIMYAVTPDTRDKGYATEIASTLAQHAIDQLSYERVIAPISPAHESSKAVAVKAGFKYHGLTHSSDDGEAMQLFVYEGDNCGVY